MVAHTKLASNADEVLYTYSILMVSVIGHQLCLGSAKTIKEFTFSNFSEDTESEISDRFDTF